MSFLTHYAKNEGPGENRSPVIRVKKLNLALCSDIVTLDAEVLYGKLPDGTTWEWSKIKGPDVEFLEDANQKTTTIKTGKDRRNREFALVVNKGLKSERRFECFVDSTPSERFASGIKYRAVGGYAGLQAVIVWDKSKPYVTQDLATPDASNLPEFNLHCSLKTREFTADRVPFKFLLKTWEGGDRSKQEVVKTAERSYYSYGKSGKYYGSVPELYIGEHYAEQLSFDFYKIPAKYYSKMLCIEFQNTSGLTVQLPLERVLRPKGLALNATIDHTHLRRREIQLDGRSSIPAAQSFSLQANVHNTHLRRREIQLDGRSSIPAAQSFSLQANVHNTHLRRREIQLDGVTLTYSSIGG